MDELKVVLDARADETVFRKLATLSYPPATHIEDATTHWILSPSLTGSWPTTSIFSPEVLIVVNQA